MSEVRREITSVMRHSFYEHRKCHNDGELYENYFLIPYWLTAFVLLIFPHFYSTKKLSKASRDAGNIENNMGRQKKCRATFSCQFYRFLLNRHQSSSTQESGKKSNRGKINFCLSNRIIFAIKCSIFLLLLGNWSSQCD